MFLGGGKQTVNIVNNFMHSLALLLKFWSSSITWEVVQNAHAQARPQTYCICILTRSTDDPEAGFLAICIVTERKQNLIMTLGITSFSIPDLILWPLASDCSNFPQLQFSSVQCIYSSPLNNSGRLGVPTLCTWESQNVTYSWLSLYAVSLYTGFLHVFNKPQIAQ